MSWQDHPRLQLALKDVVSFATRHPSMSRYAVPTIFLCGAADSDNRMGLREYLESRQERCRVVYAETVWDALYDISGLNALELEETLAAIADSVTIIVESFGSVAELGAFAANPSLRSKLQLVMWNKYEFDQSFLKTGPVRWVDADSVYAPTLWLNFPLAKPEFERIGNALFTGLQRSGRPRKNGVETEHAQNLRRALWITADLAYLIGPCTETQLASAVSSVMGETSETAEGSRVRFKAIVAIAIALNLITRVSRSGRANLIYRPLTDGKAETLYFKDSRALHDTRARWLNALSLLKEGRYAISAMQRDRNT